MLYETAVVPGAEVGSGPGQQKWKQTTKTSTRICLEILLNLKIIWLRVVLQEPTRLLLSGIEFRMLGKSNTHGLERPMPIWDFCNARFTKLPKPSWENQQKYCCTSDGDELKDVCGVRGHCRSRDGQHELSLEMNKHSGKCHVRRIHVVSVSHGLRRKMSDLS